MNPKNKRTLFLTSTICIILSIVAFALSHMGGASNEYSALCDCRFAEYCSEPCA